MEVRREAIMVGEGTEGGVEAGEVRVGEEGVGVDLIPVQTNLSL